MTGSFAHRTNARRHDSVSVIVEEELGASRTLLAELEAIRDKGVTPAELQRAKAQLKARFVFDDDRVSNVAHQIGYFETIGAGEIFRNLARHVDQVTLDQVAGVTALFDPSNRTIGWFDPVTSERS